MGVNSGGDYSGKYFSLTVDIDLAHHEWTPIGNYENAFEGIFNGNGHTIKNLAISTYETYEKERSNKTYICAESGLFGFCTNAQISDLTLTDVKIKVDADDKLDNLYIGALAGNFIVDGFGFIENVRVENLSFTTSVEDADIQKLGSFISLGGVVGYINVVSSAKCSIDRVQLVGSVAMADKECRGDAIYIGGIVGDVSNSGELTLSNFASYLTAKMPLTYAETNVAAIGYLLNSGNDSISRLSNGFSTVDFAMESDQMSYDRLTINVNSVAGSIAQAAVNSQFAFENIFGNVNADMFEAFTGDVGEKLYTVIEGTKITEANCAIADTLPHSCGFSADVWDMSDGTRPTIK